MDFEQWQQTPSAEAFHGDPIWRMTAFRMAVYVLDPAWDHALRLQRHGVTRSIGDQLYRAVASIGANLGEGYSRGSGADRVRFFEYALGSSREARLWYHAGRRVLPTAETVETVDLLTRIRRLLLTTIPLERRRVIRPGTRSSARRDADSPEA